VCAAGTLEIRETRRLLSVSSYDLIVTAASEGILRDRLYQAYASQHAKRGHAESSALIYRRDIRPALPPPTAGLVVDIGCGQGQLVRLLLADGYDAEGIDVSPEQVSLARAAGLGRVREGDFRGLLTERAGEIAAVTATDVLEHMTKCEVLETFDRAASALVPGGVLIARVPNAASPFGGVIRYGDFTHESSYTARSIRQLAAAAGFTSITVTACPPIAHGVMSIGRVAVWKAISGLFKVALAAETGVLGGHIVTQNLTFAARKD
jgi:2-polyprenyl-3-methyl-5-hydroxy-6-metoxy-1,4-benzoquinol methylase